MNLSNLIVVCLQHYLILIVIDNNSICIVHEEDQTYLSSSEALTNYSGLLSNHDIAPGSFCAKVSDIVACAPNY